MIQLFSTQINSGSSVTYGQVVITLVVLFTVFAVIIFKSQKETSKN